MAKETDSCKIAKITKIFGNDGSVVMRLYDSFPDEVDFEEPLFVLMDGLTTPLFFNSFQRRGKDKAVACFDDIDTLYRAEFILGCEAIALVEEEDEDDELYYENMVGFSFLDNVTGRCGEVVDFVDNENNPLFEVIIDGVSVMVPLSDDLIDDIDQDQRRITMSLPEGLIDLYV